MGKARIYGTPGKQTNNVIANICSPKSPVAGPMSTAVDEFYIMVGAHIDDSLQEKIRQCEYVDFARLHISFYSDASASDKLGFGCLLNSKLIQGFWEPKFIEQKPSIEFLELFALTVGILTWQNHEELTNCWVVVFCDNTAVVQMINNMSSSCKHCMVLLRKLVLNGLKWNHRVAAKYVSTKANYLVDSLSRGQWKQFHTLELHMNQFPDEISDKIWPINKVWNV